MNTAIAVPSRTLSLAIGGRRLAAHVLRVGAGLCFIGHGAFGIITKEAWLPYFAFAGIGAETAWQLMPVVGVIDIAVGVLVLASPRPAFLLYMAAWAFWTAALRPLAGEPVWEMLERAGNYGVPVALLVLAGWLPWRRRAAGSRDAGPRPREVRSGTRHRWFAALSHDAAGDSGRTRTQAMFVLRATTALLLAGHGALALLTRKPLLAEHLSLLGIDAGVLPAVGAFEIALAAAVAVRPVAPLLATILLWKLATELLYPLSGAPVWEFIERAGSYAAPLALLLLGRRASHHGSPPANESNSYAKVKPGSCRPGAVGTAVAIATLISAACAPRAAAQEAADLVAQLRQGGYVLAFRHTHTDRSRQDRRVDLSDRSTQRNLSEQGIRDARRIGEAIRALGIPVGEVYTSPFFRTLETATGAFERVDVDEALSSQNGSSDRRRALFNDPVAPGTNRVLVTHQGVLREMIAGLRGQSLEEGDIVVLRPAPDGPAEFAGMIRVADWAELARFESARPGHGR